MDYSLTLSKLIEYKKIHYAIDFHKLINDKKFIQGIIC